MEIEELLEEEGEFARTFAATPSEGTGKYAYESLHGLVFMRLSLSSHPKMTLTYQLPP